MRNISLDTFLRCCVSALLIGCCAAAHAQDVLPLRITINRSHDVIVRPIDNDTTEIQTTGTDPYVYTEEISPRFDPRRQRILAFQYRTATGANHFKVFVMPPLSEEFSLTGPALGVGEGWTERAVDLKPVLDRNEGKASFLRLVFGSQPGKTIRIRNLRLRPPSEAEKRQVAKGVAVTEPQDRYGARLRAYLQRDYPCRITSVSVTATQVRIEGVCPARASGLFLVELPLSGDVTDSAQYLLAAPIPTTATGRFSVVVERRRKERNRVWDRLDSQWAVARIPATRWELMSHFRQPDHKPGGTHLSDEKPRNNSTRHGGNTR